MNTSHSNAPSPDLASMSMQAILSSSLLRGQLASLMPQIDLSGIRLSSDPDRLIWIQSENGDFSTSKYWHMLQPPGTSFSIYDRIWQSWIPPKISGLSWRIVLAAIPTDDQIMRFGVQSASRCHCCLTPTQELIQHLFIDSEQASRIWGLLSSIFNKPQPSSIQHLLQTWVVDSSTSTQVGCLTILATCCGLWEVWRYRNLARHERHYHDILYLTRHWPKSLNILIKPSVKPSNVDIGIISSL